MHRQTEMHRQTDGYNKKRPADRLYRRIDIDGDTDC